MRNKIHCLFMLLLMLGFSPALFAQSHETPKTQSSTAGEATKSTPAEKKEEPKASAETTATIKSTTEAKPSGEAKTGSEAKPTVETKETKLLASDVRVLIDISGSMKQTDPKNLRKPALDLLVRLLPDKSRAGVWTFGNAVNMLMPLKTVDAIWRKQAAAKSNDINSIAMYTNIGKGLDEVSFDKKSLSADYKTHIVLLTDGVVDIGKDAVVNNTERQRIINEILPGLKAAGYIVHTVALSENSDTDLLKKISIATDGVYTLAVSADQLMSVFLKIFDQAVPAERVPLENNGFLVDASIKEFTALIFRKPGEDKTSIESPDGKQYSATNPADGINWYRTDTYDLITSDTPKPGQWKIKTEIAPQSRVTVVSNLQLVMEPLKNNIHSKDVLNLTYSFQENGKTITDQNFLGLLEANAIVAKEKTEENNNVAFTTPVLPTDGFFHQSLDTFPSTGDYEVHVYVDGKTFKREFKHSLTVRDSLMVLEKSSATDDHGKLTYSYKISTDEKVVDVKKTQISVSIKNSKNNNMEKNLNLLESNRWEFSFSPVQEGEYQIDIHALGELLDGDKLDENIHADTFTYEGKKADEAHSSVPAAKEEPTAEEKPVEKPNNLLLYIGAALGNLLLIAGIYFAYKFFVGGKTKDEFEEFEKTLNAGGDTKSSSSGKAPAAETTKAQEKTEIDLSDEDPAHIPMNGDDESLDNLFPLDSMDDPTNSEDKK